MLIWRKLGLVVLGAILLAGCATAPVPEVQENLNDPLQPVNRVSFEIALVLDKALARPIAVVYRGVVPAPIRDAIRNFLYNLNAPLILANDLLQGEMERAGVTLTRAVINTSVGVGGILEIAEGWGYPRHDEDFGQTLAVWGVGAGPYMFLPILGPTNPRDLTGFVTEIFTDPLGSNAGIIDWGDLQYVPLTRFGVEVLDLRARNIESVDDLELTSVDFYAAVRSLYRQARDSEIHNGATTVGELPDF